MASPKKSVLMIYPMTFPSFLRGLFLLFSLGLTGCFSSYQIPKQGPYQSQKGWVVQANQVKDWMAKGATILDVRDEASWKKQHLRGSLHTTWQHFSEPKAPNQGRLLQNQAILNQRLQALGISKTKPVLVLGDAVNGWGEEGRIVWMLRTFGHSDAHFIDGGHRALLKAGLPMTTEATKVSKGDFVIKRNNQWDIQKQMLLDWLKAKKFSKEVTLVDTRELREYNGETPYGESRGGHVPGAVNLHYKELVTSAGLLYPRTVLLKKLKEKGITPDKAVVAYCTGGIRSGWLVVVLFDLGFKDIKNYAGSMWEWAAESPSQYPLQKVQANSN